MDDIDQWIPNLLRGKRVPPDVVYNIRKNPSLLSPGITTRRRIENRFTPPGIANLSLWLDSQDSSTLTLDGGGSNVGTWVGKAGGVNATSSGTGAGPTIDSTGVNGYQGLRFLGGKKLTTGSFLSSSFNTGYTYFHVSRPVDGNLKVVTSNNGVTWFCGHSTQLFANTSGLSDTQIAANVSTEYALRPADIVGFRYNGSQKSLWRDGVRVNESATGNLGLSGSFTIGELSSGGFAFDGWVGEIIVYRSALSDDDVARVHSYLASKWGVSGPQVVCDGNSLTYGTGAVPGVSDYPTRLGVALGSGWRVINLGVSGQTTAQMNADYAGQVAPLYSALRSKNVMVYAEGTNSLFFGATAATTLAQLNTYGAAAKATGYTTAIWPVLPREGSAGVPEDGVFEAKRTTVNDDIYNPANVGVYWDEVIECAEITPFNANITRTDLYSGDKIHLIAAGYQYVADQVLPWVRSL